jgi:hypothetical protein
VRFTTASDMLAELAAQDSSSILARRLRRDMPPNGSASTKSVTSPTTRHADLLFEVVTRRYDAKTAQHVLDVANFAVTEPGGRLVSAEHRRQDLDDHEDHEPTLAMKIPPRRGLALMTAAKSAKLPISLAKMRSFSLPTMRLRDHLNPQQLQGIRRVYSGKCRLRLP